MGKRTVLWIILGIIVFFTLFCLLNQQDDEHDFVTRAQAAKTLALMHHSDEECRKAKADIIDVDASVGYLPYIKMVVSDGLMACDDGYFYPMKMITYKDLKEICQILSLDVSALSFSLDRIREQDMVCVKHWCEIIQKHNETMNTLERMTLTLTGTSATISDLDSWTCKTSQGLYKFTGLSLDAFIGKSLDVYVRDDEIVQVIDIEEHSEAVLIVSDKQLQNIKIESSQTDASLAVDTDVDTDVDTVVDTKNVRIVLNTDGYNGLIHDRVRMTCDSDFKVVYGAQTENYSAGTVFELSGADTRLDAEKVDIAPVSDEGRIQILSLNRVCGHPKYRGTIELTRKNGGIVIVNTLPVEAYLYGVVPSEMPVSYGLEALKVQAVCARSYVHTSLKGDSAFADYNADLDDSTKSQVYMNLGEDALAVEAVNATKNQVLCAGDEIVRTYFFSTSCGVTSDVSDVWGGSGQSYLVPVFQMAAHKTNDLTNEGNFRSFIDLTDGQRFFESDVSWFRWSVVIDSQSVAGGFNKVSESHKEGVIGGEILSLEVAVRGKSGIAKTLEIYSEGGTAQVHGEYSIRTALNVANLTINCHDGTQITNQSMLPSGYFYVDKIEDGQFKVCGGGFGHGVGMSQNGAAAMCNSGMDYEQVLKHFFSGTEVKCIQ